MEKMEAGVKQWPEWIISTFPDGAVVGFDFTQYPAANLEQRASTMAENNIQVKSMANLVDQCWGDARPQRPQKEVQHLDITFTGRQTLDKFEDVKKKLGGKVDCLLVTTLDDIAWLTNLRGADIDFNPVFFSYLLFYPGDENKATLYIDAPKVANLTDYLAANRITVAPYSQINEDLAKLAADQKKIGVHTSTCNAELHRIIKDSSVALQDHPIVHLKAVKNPVEQAGLREANVRDCAAIMKYFAFLETELRKPDHGLNEFNGARKVDHLRTLGKYHVQPSFDTISSIGPNGAVIHYKPEEDTALPLNNDEIYLLDSGGQYLDGTVDITRTTHFGGKPPTDFQKEAYTRVLMGVLDLERIVWPGNSSIAGKDMDILARRALWSAGLDYKHGTGHGIGHYLNVHEGPVGINRVNAVKLLEGHLLSDEPGYYEDGQFGIRIENDILCVKHPKHEGHLCWENLTVCPYSRNLIDTNLLDANTIAYINAFHQKCLEKLTPLLQDDAAALDYVQRQCAPL